jgi:hypothetical protein
MTGNLSKLLEQKKGQIHAIKKELQEYRQDLVTYENDLSDWKETQIFLQIVAKKTQQELEYRFSELLTLAMEGVFGDEAYQIAINFELRRNKTEVDIWFIRDDLKIKPLKSGGFGAADVAAAAFLWTLWCCAKPRSRNVIIQDEPFKHLKGEIANERVLKVVNEISSKLGLQIIMVSDERVSRDMILENADKVFEVRIRNGKSKVTSLQGGGFKINDKDDHV